MKYSIYKAIIMMIANIKIYLWIVIELMLIVSILVLSDATYRSANSEIGRLSNIYSEQAIYITYYQMDTAPSVKHIKDIAGITYSDILILQDELPENAILQYYISDMITLYKEGVFSYVNIVWGTDEFLKVQFDKYFDMGFIGQNARALLANDEVLVLADSEEKEIQAISPSSLTMNDVTHNLESFDSNQMIPTSFISTEIDSSYCIILPISERPIDWAQNNVNTTFSVIFDDFGEAPDQVNRMISILLDKHDGKFIYQYDDVLSDYVDHAEAILEEINLFLLIAKICLCVAVFGITGIMIIIVRKRKKEYAISYAMGACKLNIYLELIFEVFCISSAGSILGSLVGYFLTNLQTQSTFPVRFYFSCISVPFMVSLIIPLLVSSIIIPDVKSRDPIETLKIE